MFCPSTPTEELTGANEYFFVKNLQGDILKVVDNVGDTIITYHYNAWGEITSETVAVGYEDIANRNIFRYRGYIYDTETQLYYLQSRYYDPAICRFINADGEISGVGGEICGYNMFSYCFNNPVNLDDSTGQWPKWLSGAMNVIGGAIQMAAGAALGATVGWTGIGAVAAGLLIVNGAATIAQGTGQLVNSATKSNLMREDNIIKTGVQSAGKAIGGDKGAKVAGVVYDTAVIAAGLYAGRIGLQQAGKIPVKVPTFKVVDNPLDEFVTIGPKAGKVVEKINQIQSTGQYTVYATPLSNGYYQITNGHHTVQALRSLGEDTIKIFITK